jgi:methionine-rich copper-binding protein CopC
MKRRSIGLLAGMVALRVAVAGAHAHLLEAVPADQAVLHSAPRELTLRFSEPAQLTALALEHDGGAPAALSLPAGQAQRIVVTLPALAPGHYRVSFRALSADGHIVPGQVRFTLSP